jgi:hypothetical protein
MNDKATVHQVPTIYIEYRGWSQEIHIYHSEQTECEGKRFRAVGRHTAFDKEATITCYGATADWAVEQVRDQIERAHWQTHYKSINDELLYLRSEIERLTKSVPPPSADPATSSLPHAAHG